MFEKLQKAAIKALREDLDLYENISPFGFGVFLILDTVRTGVFYLPFFYLIFGGTIGLTFFLMVFAYIVLVIFSTMFKILIKGGF